jgi:hypothetical protein
MRSLAQDVSALDAALVEANSRAAAGLEARFDAAILTMAGIGLVVSGYFRISGERRVLARLLLRRRWREELRGAQAIDSPGESLGAVRVGSRLPPTDDASSLRIAARSERGGADPANLRAPAA